MADTDTTATDWHAWQESWDRQQEWYMPDREERFRIMLDMMEAFVGTEPRVLDLACGTGSITARLLARFPGATSTGVDLDPALLTIARGTFEGDDRVSFVEADLKDPAWPARLPHGAYDAVLTATALHWLRTGALEALYGQVAELVRYGGVFMNADHMIDDATPASTRPRVLSGTPAWTGPCGAGPWTGRSGGSRPRRIQPWPYPPPVASRSTAPTPTARCPPSPGMRAYCARRVSPRPVRCGARRRTPCCSR
ncbi:class I SAM-dependent methyltransferase [Streptomyces chiangmaiensis]